MASPLVHPSPDHFFYMFVLRHCQLLIHLILLRERVGFLKQLAFSNPIWELLSCLVSSLDPHCFYPLFKLLSSITGQTLTNTSSTKEYCLIAVAFRTHVFWLGFLHLEPSIHIRPDRKQIWNKTEWYFCRKIFFWWCLGRMISLSRNSRCTSREAVSVNFSLNPYSCSE